MPHTSVGYKSYYISLGKFLQKQPFADKIKVKGTQDWVATGNFDVIVGDTLVHSKKRYGEGRANTAEERTAICNAIEEALRERNL